MFVLYSELTPVHWIVLNRFYYFVEACRDHGMLLWKCDLMLRHFIKHSALFTVNLIAQRSYFRYRSTKVCYSFYDPHLNKRQSCIHPQRQSCADAAWRVLVS
jgi:hypothetical protein